MSSKCIALLCYNIDLQCYNIALLCYDIVLLCYNINLQCYGIEAKFYEKPLMNELSRKIFKTSDGAELSHPMAAQLLIMFFN